MRQDIAVFIKVQEKQQGMEYVMAKSRVSLSFLFILSEGLRRGSCALRFGKMIFAIAKVILVNRGLNARMSVVDIIFKNIWPVAQA
jgi:hypothetical protein